MNKDKINKLRYQDCWHTNSVGWRRWPTWAVC